MPGSDASIYNLIRPQPITPLRDPQEMALRRMQLQNAERTGRLGDLNLEETRRGIETNRTIQGMVAGRPDLQGDALINEVAKYDWKRAQEMRKEQAELAGKKATTGKTTAETGKLLAQQGRDLIAAATPESLPSVLEWGVKNNQQWALKAPVQIMSDPAAFSQWQRQNVLGADEWLKRNAPTISEAQTAATAAFTPGPNGPVPNQAAQDFAMRKAAAGRSKITTNILPPQKTFENEDKLRNDYTAHPMVKSSSELQNAFNLIETAYKRPSAANDLAMATKYMKILDPTSVVRESEFALAVNATGLLDKVQNYADSVLKGRKLNPTQRKDFYDSAKAINDAFQSERQKVDDQYAEMATGYGLNPKNVIPRLRTKESAPTTPAPPKLGERKDGYIYKGGDPSKQSSWEKI